MEAKRKPRVAELLSGMVKAIAEFEGTRVEVINEELGEGIRRGGATLERYRNGRMILRDPAEIRYLAEIAVSRGFLNGVWLQEFLKVTNYPHPETLLTELGSAVLPSPVHVPSEPWYDNLDLVHVPFGGTFVFRRDLLADLLKAVSEASVVVLLGMGGMGKTSLAYHLAALCRERRSGIGGHSVPRLPGEIPSVRAVIWVSDMDRPGMTTREQLIDTVVRTLDHPGLSALAPDMKQDAMLQLLATIPTLLIVDNAETISDPTLIPWLLNLPSSTRVLITSRRMTELYHNVDRVKVLPLGGLTDPEARRLVKEHARYLGLEFVDSSAQQALLQRSGNCPQALKQILGYAKRACKPLGAVVAQFDALASDLLADVFARFWDEVLSEEARRLLVALTCFHHRIAREALTYVTGFSLPVLDAAILQLSDTALIDTQTSPFDMNEPRFGLHPLTRAFVTARLPAYEAFVADAAARLITWAANYADSFGYKIHDLGLLAHLEADEATLMQALRDAAARQQHADVIRLAKGLEFFYYIKCRWDDKLSLHEHYIAAASALGDSGEQIGALTMHIQLLCRLGRPNDAGSFLTMLQPFADSAVGEGRFHVLHAQALSLYTRGELHQAQGQWKTIVEQAETWGLPEHMSIGALHWLGLSSKQLGDLGLARAQFEHSLELARQGPRPIARWVTRNQLQLALLDMAEGKLAQAERRLEENHDLFKATDREQHAHLRRVEARLKLARKQTHDALAIYHEARDLFTRMGLLHELSTDDKLFGIVEHNI